MTRYKVKMAKRMLTRAEKRSNHPIFESKAWKTRKQAIKDRLIKRPNS